MSCLQWSVKLKRHNVTVSPYFLPFLPSSCRWTFAMFPAILIHSFPSTKSHEFQWNLYINSQKNSTTNLFPPCFILEDDVFQWIMGLMRTLEPGDECHVCCVQIAVMEVLTTWQWQLWIFNLRGKLSLFEPIARSFPDAVGKELKELTFYFQSQGTIWRSSIPRKFVCSCSLFNVISCKQVVRLKYV